MTIRMNNVGIVVEDLSAVIDFFVELGLELEGRAMAEGEWAGRVTGLADQRVEVAMMRTPDGHGRLELSRFLAPEVIDDHRNAPVNALGYLRVMFEVDDLDDTLARAVAKGARLVGPEVVQYENVYRLCYIRGPENILVGLARTSAENSLDESALARTSGVGDKPAVGALGEPHVEAAPRVVAHEMPPMSGADGVLGHQHHPRLEPELLPVAGHEVQNTREGDHVLRRGAVCQSSDPPLSVSWNAEVVVAAAAERTAFSTRSMCPCRTCERPFSSCAGGWLGSWGHPIDSPRSAGAEPLRLGIARCG